MLRALLLGPMIVVGLTGCNIWGRNDSFVKKPSLLSSLMVPDEADATEIEDDEWGFVAQEARGSQELEHDPDPWWQMHFMSAKARSIERNVGISSPGE